MNKVTNIGVQLMPLVLVAASVAYYYAGATALCITCFVIAVLFWTVIFNQSEKR